MKKLQIVTGEKNTILRTVSEPVRVFDKKLKKLVKQMIEAMHRYEGIGIAAPQIGINERIFITTINCYKKNQREIEMINPEILEISEDLVESEEGCLSLPGRNDKIHRHPWLTVRFQDKEGIWNEMKLVDLDAIIVQHELDHLNGGLYIDRIGE